MSLVPTSFRSLRSVPSAALALLALAAAPCLPAARGVTIQVPYAIGLPHDQAAPYNFTGRVFDLANVAFGSGTLLRRHTVQTAGHVVYDPTTGFIADASFTRALYEDYRLSVDQVIAAAALSGYQSDVTTSGNNANLTAFENDMGYVLLHDPPVDENWANYVTTPTLLSNPSSQFFILGYPGDGGFDGLTMAYIVPMTPFVPVGSSLSTGEYENDTYDAISGMSGGPIYVVPDGVHQYVAASTVGGLTDSTGEFNQSFVRAIDKSAGKFLAAAEYTSGLITKVKVGGPKTVSRGHTYTYTASIHFEVPTDSGAAATTDRYTELKLESSTPGTTTLPLVTITKTSNTTFNVTFSNNIRAGATTVLQIYYAGTATPLGKSFVTVKVE